MKVGSLQETVTVTGETPVVDVQSAKRQQTITSEMLTSIPTARAANALLTLIPSMVQSGGNNVNVQLQPGMVVFGGRGGRSNEGRLQLDGLNTGASVNGGGVSGYTADVQNAAEITMAPSGGLGENEVGGPAMNIVPRTGGNTFKGYTYASFTGDKLQGSNYTAELQAAGLRAPGAQNRLWDVSGSSGGPIVKDKVWYFTTLRHRGSYTDVVGMYNNANAGDPTKWIYVADTSRPAVSQSHTPIQPLGRVTIQASQRNKFNLFWDEQKSGNNCGAGTSTASPGDRDLQRRRIPARAAGHVDDDGDQPAAARSRRRHLPVRLGRQGARRQQPRPDQHHGTVHRRLPDQRQHPEPVVSRPGELADRVDRRAHLARVGVVCHRQQHDEGRLPGRVPRRRSVDDVAAQRNLPVQQRRPEPADGVPVAAAVQVAGCSTTRSTRRTATRAIG